MVVDVEDVEDVEEAETTNNDLDNVLLEESNVVSVHQQRSSSSENERKHFTLKHTFSLRQSSILYILFLSGFAVSLGKLVNKK